MQNLRVAVGASGEAGLGDAGMPAGFAMHASTLGTVIACAPPSMDAGMTSVPDASGAGGCGI
jgi:hypothetical protein